VALSIQSVLTMRDAARFDSGWVLCHPWKADCSWVPLFELVPHACRQGKKLLHRQRGALSESVKPLEARTLIRWTRMVCPREAALADTRLPASTGSALQESTVIERGRTKVLSARHRQSKSSHWNAATCSVILRVRVTLCCACYALNQAERRAC